MRDYVSITAKDPAHPELDQRRQDAFLLSAGFQPQDLAAVRQVVHDFKTAYDALIEEHNSADAAGRNPSLVTLKIRRDNLVNQTQASLLSIKLETAERVSSFINREKRSMRVSKTEVQP